jgi:MFS family permease
MVASYRFDRLKAWILACTLVANTAYAIIAPFLPIEMENKGISTIWMAPIFAIYSLGIVVFSPLVSELVTYYGAVNIIAVGMAGTGISLVCFGLVMLNNNVNVVIGIVLVARFIQGAASAFIQTACYILTTNMYPNDQEHIIGLMEAMTGVGILLGPVIGSALYAATNFETAFLQIGNIILLFAVGIAYGFPKSTRNIGITRPTSSHMDQSKFIKQEDQNTEDPTYLDDSSVNPDVEDDATTCGLSVGAISSTCSYTVMTPRAPPLHNKVSFFEKEPTTCGISVGSAPRIMCSYTVMTPRAPRSKNEVSYWQLAKLARLSLGLLGAALCLFMYCFLEPILSHRLLDFELSVPQIGLFFAIFPIFYIPTSVCVQWIPDWIEKRVTIALSLMVSSFAFLLVGPSQILPFPDSLLMIGIGWGLLGISLATFLVPILPEIVEASLPHFPGQDKQVKNMCSGLFNSFLGIGQFISPLYGSIVSDRVGFRLTTDIAAIIGFTFFIIYFAFADVRRALQKSFGRIKATTYTYPEWDMASSRCAKSVAHRTFAEVTVSIL